MKKPFPAFWLLSSTFSSLALTVIGTTSSLATEYNERFQHQRFAVEHGLTEDVSDPQALNTSSLSRPTHGSSHRESLLHTSGTHDPVTKVLKYIVEFQPNPSELHSLTTLSIKVMRA